MSNEFVARKGIISKGKTTVEGDLVVSQGIYGTNLHLSSIPNGSLLVSNNNTVGHEPISKYATNTTVEGISSSLDNRLSSVESITGNSVVSSTDKSLGVLNDKLIKGPGIIKTTINQGNNEQLQFKLGPHYLSLASSGLYEGAILSVGSTQGTIDISSGNGLFIDSTTNFSDIQVGGVNITEKTNIPLTNIATQPVTYIGIDKNDQVVEWSSFPTPEQRRNAIFIGVAVHSNNVDVNVVNNIPSVALDVTGQLQDLMIGLGFFNLSGNIIYPNGSNLSINKTSGKAFKAGANFNINPKDPHTLSLGDQNTATFRYRNLNSSEDLDTILIDPTTYDDNGTTTLITGSGHRATIQRIYIFPSNIIRIQRGQEIYNKFSDAIDAVGKELHVTEPNIHENGLLLASLVLTKDCTDLSDPTKAQFFQATRFGELGSVGSTATGTIQDAYNNSIDPEILTDNIRGALSIRQGSGSDNDNILEIEDGSANKTCTINGTGNVSISGSMIIGAVKQGYTQNNAGAVKGEIWKTNGHSSLPDNVLMIGV